MIFRNLKTEDYNTNYLDLLAQLTEVNPEKIDFNSFSNFVNNLNYDHRIIVIEINIKKPLRHPPGPFLLATM